MLSSHLFFCLPLLLAPFTVPCRNVFAMQEDLEMWPYHLSFLFFTMVRRSSCTPIAFCCGVRHIFRQWLHNSPALWCRIPQHSTSIAMAQWLLNSLELLNYLKTAGKLEYEWSNFATVMEFSPFPNLSGFRNYSLLTEQTYKRLISMVTRL